MPDAPFDITAELDQMAAGLRDLAPVIRTYLTALTAQGFTDDQALAITVGWQAALLRNLAR